METASLLQKRSAYSASDGRNGWTSGPTRLRGSERSPIFATDPLGSGESSILLPFAVRECGHDPYSSSPPESTIFAKLGDQQAETRTLRNKLVSLGSLVDDMSIPSAIKV